MQVRELGFKVYVVKFNLGGVASLASVVSVMSLGHRIGLQFCRALVRSSALISRRCVLARVIVGGSLTQEPWWKSAMDILNRELMQQGTQILGQPVDPAFIPPSPAAGYEKIFEQQFPPCSHEFRLGLSQHTCLKQVCYDFQGTVWYIEGKSLLKYFDQIRLETMEQLLMDKI